MYGAAGAAALGSNYVSMPHYLHIGARLADSTTLPWVGRAEHGLAVLKGMVWLFGGRQSDTGGTDEFLADVSSPVYNSKSAYKDTLYRICG